ncbi:MAG: efflux RND transporter permease subunit [Acidobacteria bacterium]|nr:MAG: efflux RND transporter permease subunit [Acidobacteriota bacterium]
MKGIIAWFADNGVAANLIMILIIVGGVVTLFGIKQEVFPEFSADVISVRVLYPGAAPEEVEEGVVVRIEEAIQDLEGIDKISSNAAENMGTVLVELIQGTNTQKMLNDVKARVDAIDTFPVDSEEPVIEEAMIRRQVLEIAVSGDADERALKVLGERIREDLVAQPGITQAELAAVRPYEISIEVSEEALRQYGLTFEQVARAVRQSSLDLPGGKIKTEGGEILLRTKAQAYRGREFEELPLLTLADGTRLAVGDVATVVDGFADTERWSRFNGKPAVLIQVFRVGSEGALGVAGVVKDYLETARDTVPEGIELTVWQDQTRILKSRLDLLLKNGRNGFILVVLVLALFLKLRLAGWVSLGIPISFLGAIALMPTLDVSVNLVSLFAFIIVLGIVVDDAIIVGENIYSHYQRGREGLAAAVDGAQEVVTPVVFAVLTGVAAFAPLLAVTGNIGKIMRVIPLIVIPTLLFSLVESLLVLPNHLSHLRHDQDHVARTRIGRLWMRLQEAFSDGLQVVIERSYQPSLSRAIEWRYLTLAAMLALLIITFGVLRGGWIKFNFMPVIEADNSASYLTMPQGTPVSVTARMVRNIESAALELAAELEQENGGQPIRRVMTTIGDQPFRTAAGPAALNVGADFSATHLGEVNLELAPSEERDITSTEVADRWREKVGAIPDAVELTFTSSLFSSGEAINVELSGPRVERLREFATRLKEELRSYPGVRDITDSFRAGKRELELVITPEAEAAGLTQADLARQVRQAFYGEEVQRIQRGRDDVKVMVRYPESRRLSLGDVEDLRIRTPSGTEVPFTTAADAKLSRGPATIRRTNRRRVVNVTADVNQAVANANDIIADLEAEVLPRLLADYPEIRYSLEGEQQQQRETLTGLARGFVIALLVIYALLAIPFKSYFQPLIVMSAIPFGLIGAVWGHVVLGMDLAILSMFGIVALTGVVVNDSLVMVDFINRSFRQGVPLTEAIRTAGSSRFRPILLTSLTTFAGLTPLLLERSMQARFLIPMAVSLAFGVLFATFITLILVPSLYAIQEDIRGASRRLWRSLKGESPDPASLTPEGSGD